MMFHKFFDRLTQKPLRALLFYCGLSLFLWTLQCSLLQNILGLDILETIVWGALGTLGHAKHPPLSGWIGYAFSLLSGHADWSLYLAAQLCLVTGVLFVYKTLRIFWDECYSVTAALLLYFLYYYNPSWMKFSTYFVETALIPAAAFCFFSALEKKKRIYWILFGMTCAFGFLNKYSFGLQMPAFFVIFFAKKDYRDQIKTFGPWLAVLTCFFLMIPHLIWLCENDFVCFTHVANRFHEERAWWEPFLALVITIYPFAVQGLALLITRFRASTDVKNPFRTGIFRAAMIFTLIPACFYFLLSLSGRHFISMWFCTTFSWTGAAVLACCPFRIDKQTFSRLFALLLVVTFITFCVTSLDLMLRPARRLHVRPEALTTPVLSFWNAQKCGKIPVVLGDRFLACVMENYLPGRPPACIFDDPVFYKLYRDKIFAEGALLIGFPDDLENFWKTIGIKPLKMEKVVYEYKTILGRKGYFGFFIARLKPGYDILPDRNNKK